MVLGGEARAEQLRVDAHQPPPAELDRPPVGAMASAHLARRSVVTDPAVWREGLSPMSWLRGMTYGSTGNRSSWARAYHSSSGSPAASRVRSPK